MTGKTRQSKEKATQPIHAPIAAKPEVKTKAGSEAASKSSKKSQSKEPSARMSALDAAAKLLGGARESMTCGELVEAMLAKGLWKTDGKTPAATLYSAILREITTKAKESRFRKTDRGKFALAK